MKGGSTEQTPHSGCQLPGLCFPPAKCNLTQEWGACRHGPLILSGHKERSSQGPSQAVQSNPCRNELFLQ